MRPEPTNYREYPGKMDHTTCITISVRGGGVSSSSSSSSSASTSSSSTSHHKEKGKDKDREKSKSAKDGKEIKGFDLSSFLSPSF